MKKVIDNFDFKKASEGFESNRKINILSGTVFNIMNNFIPNKTILIDDRDSPWISKKIKTLILEKNLGYRRYLKKNNPETRRDFYPVLDQVQLENSKLKYYQKLLDKLSLSNDTFKGKYYRSILKRIPCIPPLIQKINFVTNFYLKRDIFNSHFSIENSDRIPLEFSQATEKTLSGVKFSEDETSSVSRK